MKEEEFTVRLWHGVRLSGTRWRAVRLLACLAASLGVLSAEAQTYEQLTNLPHIYIDTWGGRPISSKTTYVMATMRRVGVADTVEVFDSLRIRGRGNSTWGMAKKPYRLKFNHKEKLLGKGRAKAKSWTLIANHADKTMLRNALTLCLGDWLGLKGTPAHVFADLTLNGKYQGTYMVSDHVEVHAHRVSVDEQPYPLGEDDDVTGGYLFEVDGSHDGRGITGPKSGSYIRIHYPEADEIDARQMAYVQRYFQELEQRIYLYYFRDPVRGYRAMVDSTSLANWYIATEVSANIDGLYSIYCYKERGDDRLYWGPLWDYDIAYGNDTRKGDTRRKLMRQMAFNWETSWVRRMALDPWFKQLVARRYKELLTAGLDSFMLATVDSLRLHLDQSQRLNYERWGISTRSYNERVLYSTYDEYIADLKAFIPVHNAYLAEQFGVEMNDLPPEDPDAVALPEVDYTLIYDGTSRELRFGGDERLGFTARVYTQGGVEVASFRAGKAFSMLPFPQGLYIVAWQYAGKQHSIKFMRD